MIPLLVHGPRIHGGRILAFGQAIASVVLNDIGHIEIPPGTMGKLPQANGRRISVPRNPDIDQVTVGEVRPRGHRGHAAMHGIETMRAGKKVSGSLRRTANARELGNPVRFNVQLEAGIHDGRANGIVPAARAEGR